MKRQWYSITQAAAALALSPVRVRELVRQGTARAARIGGVWRISHSDLIRFSARWHWWAPEITLALLDPDAAANIEDPSGHKEQVREALKRHRGPDGHLIIPEAPALPSEMTVSEAARIFALHEVTLRRLVAAGTLPSTKRAGRRWLSTEDLTQEVPARVTHRKRKPYVHPGLRWLRPSRDAVPLERMGRRERRARERYAQLIEGQDHWVRCKLLPVAAIRHVIGLRVTRWEPFTEKILKSAARRWAWRAQRSKPTSSE